MLVTTITVLNAAQIVFLVCACYFTYKIARAEFTPSRPWYLLSSAIALLISQKVYNLSYLSDAQKLAIQYGGVKMFVSSFILTTVFLIIFFSMAELYSMMNTKNKP